MKFNGVSSLAAMTEKQKNFKYYLSKSRISLLMPFWISLSSSSSLAICPFQSNIASPSLFHSPYSPLATIYYSSNSNLSILLHFRNCLNESLGSDSWWIEQYIMCVHCLFFPAEAVAAWRPYYGPWGQRLAWRYYPCCRLWYYLEGQAVSRFCIVEEFCIGQCNNISGRCVLGSCWYGYMQVYWI